MVRASWTRAFWKNCFDFSHSLRDWASPITLSDPHRYPATLRVKKLTKPKHALSIYWNLTFSSLTFCIDGRNLPETYYLRIITASPLTVACQGLKKKITHLSTALIFSCKTMKVAFDLFAHFSQAWLQSPPSSWGATDKIEPLKGEDPEQERNDFSAHVRLSASMLPPF